MRRRRSPYDVARIHLLAVAVASLQDDAIFGLQPALPAETKLDDLIQTDAPINPGSSGGALADLAGRVVGICTMAKTVDGDSGSIGIGFAIPIELAYADARTILRTRPAGS